MGLSEDTELKAENGQSTHRDQTKVPFLKQQVNEYLTSVPILLCCFTSGLIDSSVFNAYNVFATMQTGNTIILALGASRQPRGHPHLWVHTLLAILFYFIGAFFASRVGYFLGTLRRGTLSLSFFIQTVLIITAAALVQAEIVPGLRQSSHPGGSEEFIPLIVISMLSFQAGQQSVAARHLGINEIPTTVLTSVYCDLGNDRNLFAPLNSNWTRNRRFLAAVFLLVGAIIGGWLSRTGGGMAAGLWMAAGVKACLTVAWALWRRETNEKLLKS